MKTLPQLLKTYGIVICDGKMRVNLTVLSTIPRLMIGHELSILAFENEKFTLYEAGIFYDSMSFKECVQLPSDKDLLIDCFYLEVSSEHKKT